MELAVSVEGVSYGIIPNKFCFPRLTEVEFNIFFSLQNVGCDGKIDSNITPDLCGVCNGDNTTCETMRGNFSTSNLTTGKSKSPVGVYTWCYKSNRPFPRNSMAY